MNVTEVTLDPALVAFFELQAFAKATARRQAERDSEEAEGETLGDRQGAGDRVRESRRPIPVSSLRGVLPKDRGVRRSLPVHQSFPPRLISRPEELGL